MRAKKSILRRLIPWVIAAAIIAAIVIFIGIPLYAPQATEPVAPPVISYYEGGTKTLTMENDDLLFELDPKTTQFKVTEKTTGREWLSNPADAKDDPIAITSNLGVLQSTLLLTYSSASGSMDFNNYQYSIEDGNYLIEQAEDGTISVIYSIGQIEKVYMLPTAITAERFTAYTDAMKSSTAKRVKNVYTLYTPENVQNREDKDELLAMYPLLEEQSLYVLRAGTSENNKKSVAGFFAEVGYTEEDYASDMELVAGAAENTKPVFNVTVNYKLEGGDLLVEVPYSELRCRDEYPITFLTLLPMFGAAGLEDEGAMLIPEGGGALINFNNGKIAQNSYYANMYGWDYATERLEVVSETKNTFPVFGMIKNGGSFICIMEGASSYGGVQADISMRLNTYNWICARYNVLHSDTYNVSSAKSAARVYMFEKQIPDDTIVQRYRFVDSTDYVDMANAYGAYLREKYPSLAANDAAEEMPISVELVGAIDKKVVKFGLPVDDVVATTTFAQAEELIDDLLSRGVKSLNVRMTGWNNGGISQKVLTKVKVLRELGGEKAMKSLIASARESGVPLYFDGITCFAYDSGILQGFIPYVHAARFTTREQVKIYPYSVIFFQQDDFFDPFYLVQPEYAKDMATNLINALSRLDADGIAFRDIGYLLSADYNPKHTVTREQVKQMNIETMLEAKEAGQRVMIKEGYDYAMPYADMITDMDFRGIEYSIIDEDVPFYQIAIHGAVDYTGLPINLADDWQTELLQCAEYGAGLSFSFMAKEATVLQDTFHTGYFGAGYDAWIEDAAQIINAYQTDMAGLNRTPITGHENVTANVSVTTYANGKQVWVNYGGTDYRAGGNVIPARSYLVTGGESK
ncbi:MAG: hypothetical protein J1E43_11055 [Christensenellaceae bacterium]|nr:hypothetical protein [Christensenellaceae bacterium]